MTDVPQHSADAAPVERLHPFFLLTGIGSSLRGIAGGYAGIGYLAATDRVQVAVLGGIGLLLATVVGIFLYWRRFSFRVGTDEVRIDSGIISRTHRSIPFDRVQDVDITQGPISRLLGLAKVKFETGAAGGSEEGVLPAIALDRAEALREYVRARRGIHISQQEAAVAEPQPLFAMDLRRVLTAGVFNFSLAIFAGLIGVTQTFGDVLGFDPFERAFWESALQRAGPLADYVQTHRFGAAVAGFVTLILLGVATGIIRTLLREFRFRLDRTGTGLRRRRGLLTLTDVTLPLRRVQAGVIDSGPVRELFGWHALSVKSLAGDGGEGGGSGGDHVLAPLARRDELQAVAAELGWRLADEQTQWRRVSTAYVWSFLILIVPLISLITGTFISAILIGGAVQPSNVVESLARDVDDIAAAMMSVVFVAACVLVLVAALRWLCWKRTFYALEDDRLMVRTGWWNRQTLLLPLANVQSVDLIATSLSRWFGTAHVSIGIAGGSLMGHRIPHLPADEARQVRQALLSRFA